MNNRTIGFILVLGAAAWAIWRMRAGAGVNPSPGGGLGAGGSGGNLTIGQVGATIVESNSLADAVNGLVRGIWGTGGGGGEGYGGALQIETADGSFRYTPPNNTNPLLTNSRTGKLYFNP